MMRLSPSRRLRGVGDVERAEGRGRGNSSGSLQGLESEMPVNFPIEEWALSQAYSTS